MRGKGDGKGKGDGRYDIGHYGKGGKGMDRYGPQEGKGYDIRGKGKGKRSRPSPVQLAPTPVIDRDNTCPSLVIPFPF